MRIVVAFALLGVALPALAGPLDRPVISTGDAWVYDDTFERGTATRERHEEISVVRASTDSILVSIKEVGSTAAPHEQLFGPDWSRFRSVNGAEETVNRPFAFPLAPGKTWRVDYTEEHPNPQHLREHIDTPYRVIGWETIQVPAGEFKALKIESNGRWTADLAARVVTNAAVLKDSRHAAILSSRNTIAAQTASGRLYKAFWYLPEAKRWIKSVEEYYNAGGTRTERFTSELESATALNR